jgi:hypothetical protein
VPLATIQHPPRPRPQPRRRLGVETGGKVRGVDFGPAPNAYGFDPAAHATIEATAPATRNTFEQPQNPDSAIASRTTKKAPRSAIGKTSMGDPNRKLNLIKTDKSRRSVSRDNARSPQTGNADSRQIVAKYPPHDQP